MSKPWEDKVFTKEQAFAEAESERGKVRGCLECVHVGSDGEYSWTFHICNKHRHLSNLKSFPFKRAPKCFELSLWCSPFAMMVDGSNESAAAAWDAMDEWELVEAAKAKGVDPLALCNTQPSSAPIAPPAEQPRATATNGGDRR